MPLVAGSRFAYYEVRGLLGRGGMASVYHVWEGPPPGQEHSYRGLKRDVALKVLPPALLHEPDFAERIVQEAALLAGLEHPYIVPVYSAGVDEDTPWIAMRLLRGGSLKDLATSRRLPLQRLLKILAHVAEALDFAHAQRPAIVHRDVKPGNVLLDSRENAYLSDFGIAELLEGTSFLTRGRATDRGAAGTVHYMAPEQARGAAVPQSDVYALGITAYELLTGAVPFTGSHVTEVILKHLQEPVPVPSPDLVTPKQMASIARALEKDPRLRWPSAGAFIEALASAEGRGQDPSGRAAAYELRFGPAASLDEPEITEVGHEIPAGVVGMRFKRADNDFDISEIEVRLFARTRGADGGASPATTAPGSLLSKKVSPLARGQHVFFKAWEVTKTGRYEVEVVNPRDGSLLAHGGFEVTPFSSDRLGSDGIWNEAPPPPPPRPAPAPAPAPSPQPPTQRLIRGVMLTGIAGLTVLGAGCVAFLILLAVISPTNNSPPSSTNTTATVPREAPAAPPPLWPRPGNLVGADGAPLVRIPAGEFLMGAADDDTDAWADERPQHRVHVNAFALDKFEVTVGQYRKFLDALAGAHGTCPPAEPPNKDHRPRSAEWTDTDWTAPQQPVVAIDWWDAAAYCQWAGRRLPTEAEWEKAARGPNGRVFPWGGDGPGAFPQGNFGDEEAKKGLRDMKAILSGYDDGFAVTAPVGSFPRGASPYGVEDMAGNVWEWTSDWYSPDYYGASPARNPTGPKSGTERVKKGGAFMSVAKYLRASIRFPSKPEDRANGVGFRCAVDVR